jgi:hypothetical protein
VREAVENDNWIRDLPSNLTVPLISDYVLLWELVDEAGFDPQDNEEDEIIWIELLMEPTRQNRRMNCSFPKLHLENLGTVKMQVLPLAHASKQDLDFG